MHPSTHSLTHATVDLQETAPRQHKRMQRRRGQAPGRRQTPTVSPAARPAPQHARAAPPKRRCTPCAPALPGGLVSTRVLSLFLGVHGHFRISSYPPSFQGRFCTCCKGRQLVSALHRQDHWASYSSTVVCKAVQVQSPPMLPRVKRRDKSQKLVAGHEHAKQASLLLHSCRHPCRALLHNCLGGAFPTLLSA